MTDIKKGDRVIAHGLQGIVVCFNNHGNLIISVWERYDDNHGRFVCYLKCPIGCAKVTKI